MKEVEISIKGLFFYIFKRWKSIVIAMLIGAVALGALQMVRSMRTTQSVQTTTDFGASLTDSERAYVESVYNYRNEVLFINEERRDSLFMQLDPEYIVKTDLVYMISVDNAESMDGVELAYKNYLYGSGFLGYIFDKTGIDTSDIADTVTVTYERSGEGASNTAIKITIVSGDETSANLVAKAVNSYLCVKNSELSSGGYENELTEIGSTTYIGPDFNVQNRQLQYLQEIQARIKTVIDAENAIKDAQKEYYKSLLKQEDEEDSNDDTVIVNSAKLPVKYIILGMLGGAFLMCGLYFLIYILANRLDADDDVEKMFGTYLIGTVTGKDYSKPIYKLQHLGKRTFSFDESIKLISTKIKLATQKENVSTIGILGCGIRGNNEKAADEIIAILKKNNI